LDKNKKYDILIIHLWSWSRYRKRQKQTGEMCT